MSHWHRIELSDGNPEQQRWDLILGGFLGTKILCGFLTKPYWFSFVLGMRRINRSYMGYSPRLLMQLVEALPPDSMFSVMGVGNDELPATTQSILLGGHVRVGFEDNVYYEKGELADNNAQLVARTVRMAKELGCEIASPAEAREMLGIAQL